MFYQVNLAGSWASGLLVVQADSAKHAHIVAQDYLRKQSIGNFMSIDGKPRVLRDGKPRVVAVHTHIE